MTGGTTSSGIKMVAQKSIIDGVTYNASDLQNIVDIIKKKYGGGSTYVLLPNMVSKYPFGTDTNGSNLGQSGGDYSLSASKLKWTDPDGRNHEGNLKIINSSYGASGSSSYTGKMLVSDEKNTYAQSEPSANLTGTYNNPPYLTMNFIIKYK